MTSPNPSPNGAMLYTQGFGSRPENVEIPILQNRAPTAQDTQKGFFPIGKRWINETLNTEYVLTSYSTSGGPLTAVWGVGGTASAGTATGAAASPVVLNGRAGQVTFSSVSIAAAADLTLTITNSAITSTSQILYSMSGATTGSALTIKSVTNTAGSSAIVVTNGTGATTSTANIVLTFLVIN